jgi:hypothetical protein
VFDWLGELLTFNLEPDQGGCRLVFTHTFNPDAKMGPLNATGRHVCLDAMEAVFDGRSIDAEKRRADLLPIYQRTLDPDNHDTAPAE